MPAKKEETAKEAKAEVKEKAKEAKAEKKEKEPKTEAKEKKEKPKADDKPKAEKKEKPKEEAAEQKEPVEEPSNEEPTDSLAGSDIDEEYMKSIDTKKLLIDPETYLKHGVHIGLTYRTGNMSKFIYKVRPDRLSIFSLNQIDERIRLAAKFLAQYDKKDVLVIGSRAYARRPVRMFAELTGVNYVSGRFRPGTFTNPREKNYEEPEVVLVADPIADKQAVREAARVGTPLIGVCDSNALTRNIDLIVPLNNKGKHSIALFFWLLTRQYLLEKGELSDASKFDVPVGDFVSQIQPTKRVETLIKTKRKDKFRT